MLTMLSMQTRDAVFVCRLLKIEQLSHTLTFRVFDRCFCPQKRTISTVHLSNSETTYCRQFELNKFQVRTIKAAAIG